jgi:hypothetical protein
MRTTLEGRAKELAKTTGTEDAFRTAWQMDGDVRRVASVALVLTNLDNEIARLFTGLQSSHGLSVAVRGRDLVYRETLTLTATGGSFSKINPSAFLDAARQAEPTASLLWSTGPASRLETAAPGVLAIPAGSRSVVLAVEWTERNAVVDTCRRMSALAFQGATIRVPGSYAATVRGEVIPMSRTDPVPMAVTFTASALRQLTVPAYSLFVASRPMKASDPAGPDGDEQILTLAQPVTEAAAQTAPVWIEMLPSPFRVKAIQVAKDSLFPANAPLTLILLGIATLASVKLVPRVSGPAAVG